MIETFDDVGQRGKNFAGSGLDSLASLSKGAQAIAAEASEYTSKSFEAGGAAVEQLFSATSLGGALEIQADYLKRSYEGFVAEATRISGLYADLVGNAYRPFEMVGAKAK